MRSLGLALALLLAGCAANPKQTSLKLSEQDPKFNSEDCRTIRNKVVDYDDKVGQRVAIGLASGLLLGPLGIPVAAMADAEQNKEREFLNRELQRRCSSVPLPPEPEVVASPLARGD